jgi:hypothetical protein
MEDNLQQIAEEIVRHDPDLYGTLTEIIYGNDNKFKLERILHWSNQWKILNQKPTMGKSQQKHS